MLTNSTAVRVAVETSEGQVELELAPAVEIPNAWSKRARWPRCLTRWPAPERVQCIKVPAGRAAPRPRSPHTDARSSPGRSTADCQRLQKDG